jgi:hypothetical protein
MDRVEQRLFVLERELQRSRRVNRFLIFVVIAVACMARAQGKPPIESQPLKPAPVPSAAASQPDRLRTVEAERIVLLDRLGQSRLRIGVDDDGPAITMFDEKGNMKLRLAQSESSSGLRLLSADESPVVSLEASHAGDRAHLEVRSQQGSSLINASGISVRDAADHGRLHLSLTNPNYASLGISQSGQNGPSSIEMTATDRSRSLKIHDASGFPVYDVFATEEGQTSVILRHPDHERTLQISTGPEDVDAPTVAFFAPANEDGTGGQLPFLQFGLQRDHQARFRIADRAGRTRFAAPSE